MEPDSEPTRWTALHVAGLWAVAVAQPLLDLLGKGPTFFIAHRADPVEVAAFVGGLVIAPPAALASLLWLIRRLGGPTRYRLALGASVVLLAAAFAALLIKEAGVQVWWLAVPAAAALGGAAGWLYLRAPAARTFATVLSIAVLVVPAVFIAQPGVPRLFSPPPPPGTGSVRTHPDAPRPAPPVVLVIMDETPLLSLLDESGLIDSRLYPNLAQLARDGVWFRNATAVSDDTRWAVPAILSGRYPRTSLMPTQADYPDTLFTQLAASHRLEVVETITRLCRFAACNEPRTPLAARLAALADDLRILYLHRLLTNDLRRSLPPLTTDWARFGVAGAAERRQRRAERAHRQTNNLQIATDFAGWISRDDPQPVFYFFHSLLPHSPWQWLPSGQRNATRAPIPEAGVAGVPESEWGVVQQYQRHLLQAGVIDRVIGLYVQRLKEAGLYDRALLVVASDHGVAFQPGLPRRDFRDATAAEIMRVPLLVKFPSGERPVPGLEEAAGQRISDRNAETIDIAPTVLDVLGLEPTAAPDGASLLRPLEQERRGKRMVFGADGTSRVYDRAGPDLVPALAAKSNRFGPDNPYRIPRPARFAGLVGRRVGDLRVRENGGAVTVDRLSAFTSFEATETSAPFDVAGQVVTPVPMGVTWLAVAVNGRIRAVTRTWDAEPARWLATPPLDAWNFGRNQVEVFIVRGNEEAPELGRTSVSEGLGDAQSR